MRLRALAILLLLTLAAADVRAESLTPPAPPVVVIDPGHGGDDLGAVGVDGTFEKTITLAVAHRLAAAMAARDDVVGVLTRTTDRRVPLAERLAVAAEVEADLFVSLHADSLPRHPRVRGASVYTLSTVPTDTDAARKARRENRGDARLERLAQVDDEMVRAILTSLVRTANAERSTDLADEIARTLARTTPLLTAPRRAADFVVLRSLKTPSVLVELGYVSNVDEAAALGDPAHQDALAGALLDAILAFAAAGP